MSDYNPNNHTITFSDDTAILALMKKESDISDYYSGIQGFVKWCEDNHLVLNVNKTEEMVFDPRRVGDHRSVIIHNETISQVSSYKYLGIFIDISLTWNTHVVMLQITTMTTLPMSTQSSCLVLASVSLILSHALIKKNIF